MSAPLKVRLDLVRFSTYDANGYLGLQYDAYGEEQSGVPDVEAFAPYGFWGRPLDPQLDANGEVVFGAHMLNLWEGAESFAIALGDPRLMPGLPQLEKGESLQHGASANFVRCHADGRVSTMCTSDGTANGQAVSSVVAPDGFSWVAQWAQLRHDALGLHYQHVSGATLDMGGVSGLPGPLAGPKSYCQISAVVISIKGTTVQLGTGAFDAAAKATPTLAVDTSQQSAIVSLQATVTALSGAVTALTAILQNAAAAPAAAAAAAAVATSASATSASGSALSAATVTLPAKATQVA